MHVHVSVWTFVSMFGVCVHDCVKKKKKCYSLIKASIVDGCFIYNCIFIMSYHKCYQVMIQLPCELSEK